MSIRTYLFISLASLVLLISAFLSFQSAKIFIGAFQVASEDFMYELGHEFPKNQLTQQNVIDFHITTEWAQVPRQIKEQFPSPQIELDRIHTRFIDWNYISPPNRIYSLMVVETEQKLVYVSRFKENFREEIAQEHPDEMFIDPMVIIIAVGIAFFILFVVTLFFVFRKIAKPMESLQSWANQLTLDNLNKERPSFRFKELNALAALIHDNFSSLASSVEREQKFLSYASHELRTPIAVLRSNCSLLEKVNANPSDKERAIRQRINRASLTMKSMTETLLWLSRDEDMDMPIESIDLGQTLKQVNDELAYLIAGKDITVTVDDRANTIFVPRVPVTLILNNLLRNALQHTQKGRVIVTQSDYQVTITNIETKPLSPNHSNELGFGLGTQLIESLIARFNWEYHKEIDDNSYCVTVVFANEKP